VHTYSDHVDIMLAANPENETCKPDETASANGDRGGGQKRGGGLQDFQLLLECLDQTL